MYYEAMSLEQLKSDIKARVVINDIPILLTYYQEKVYAINDQCPHLRASLVKGSFENGVVTCQSHKAQIDVTNGHIINKAKVLFIKMPTKQAKTYLTQIKDNQIFIEI